MARNKQFKAESKRLLDLMINSIYTHKEIFLRELISNASDAMDKLYYKSLTENLNDVDRSAFKIHLDVDKENRTITISDNGLGMNKEELEDNLGTIAKSGSLAFKEGMEEQTQKDDAVDIIGQFGVGFYSAFMVAARVEVITKKYGEKTAYLWSSNASDGYSIEETSKESCGSQITLHLKENSDDENYDEYLEQYEIERLIKKYSDYIRFPIEMMVETQKEIEQKEEDKKEGEETSPKYESVLELKTLNSMIPLWKRNKSEITKEEYNEFYQAKFNDYNEPQRVIHTSVEGSVSFSTLLFIPSKA
ncbi:MAG: ATP-binding protein, partial [Longicatena sp.]